MFSVLRLRRLQCSQLAQTRRVPVCFYASADHPTDGPEALYVFGLSVRLCVRYAPRRLLASNLIQHFLHGSERPVQFDD